MAKDFSLVRNALLMPFEGSMDAFASGVFADGAFVEGTLLERGKPATVKHPEEHLAGTYIFGGYLFAHYGHFLLESLSRAYAVARCKPWPVLVMSPNEQIGGFQREVLACIGLNNEIIRITKPTSVESLVLSPAGSIIHPPRISPEQLEALGKVQPPARQPHRKVWLSRSRVQGGGVEDEAELEREIARLGWEIVHPQFLPAKRQAQLIGCAGRVAGFDGSAFLTVLLARQVQGRFQIFSRRNRIPLAIRYIFAAKGIALEEHVPAVEHLSGQGASSRYRLQDPEEVLRVLRG